MEVAKNCTTTPSPTHQGDRDLKYLIVPIIVIFLVMFLSALVYLMTKRRRRRDDLRQSLLNLYEFDSKEHEWEPLNSNEHPTYTSSAF